MNNPDPNTIHDDPHGPNKFSPTPHPLFPNQPIDPDRTVGGPRGMTQAEIDRRLDLHTPSDQGVKDLLDAVRAEFKKLYQGVVRVTADAPREQAIALHHLEDALQSTIAAIVRPKA